MQNLAKRIEIVQKLQALAANNDSEEEALSAMGKAQEMIERFNITEAMLKEAAEEENDTPEPIKRDTVYDRKKGKMPTWILALAGGVTRANRVVHWYSSSRYHGTISGCGTETNLESCKLLMPFLVGEVDRLYQEEKPSSWQLARMAREWCTSERGAGKRWATSFRNGCALRIAQRLREAKKQAAEAMKAEADPYKAAIATGDVDAILELDKAPPANPKFALAKVETALARLEDDHKRTREWYSENMAPNMRKGSSRNWSGTAYNGYSAGRAAGNRANIRGPKGQIKG